MFLPLMFPFPSLSKNVVAAVMFGHVVSRSAVLENLSSLWIRGQAKSALFNRGFAARHSTPCHLVTADIILIASDGTSNTDWSIFFFVIFGLSSMACWNRLILVGCRRDRRRLVRRCLSQAMTSHEQHGSPQWSGGMIKGLGHQHWLCKL